MVISYCFSDKFERVRFDHTSVKSYLMARAILTEYQVPVKALWFSVNREGITMLNDRFEPLDADTLSEKADSLGTHSDDLKRFADPRQDRMPYRELMAMRQSSHCDENDLERHRSAMRKMTRRLSRMLPAIRRLQSQK